MRWNVKRLHRRNDPEPTAPLTVDVFEFRQNGNRIEAKILGVSAHDSTRIRQRRKVVKLFTLKCHEVMSADSRGAFSLPERHTFVGTRVTQQLAELRGQGFTSVPSQRRYSSRVPVPTAETS